MRSVSREPGLRHSSEQIFSVFPTEKKESIGPDYIDLCHADLTSLNLEDMEEALQNTLFDTETIWTYQLPAGFNPKQMIKNGKTAGLNINLVHQMGLTGKHVGIAIVGEIPNINHEEYKSRLVYYDEVRDFQFLKRNKERLSIIQGEDTSYSPLRADQDATYRGSAACAITVGHQLGTAPGADLYYISTLLDPKASRYKDWATEAVLRVLNINKFLGEDKKIRVLIVDSDIDHPDSLFTKVLDQAYEQNILVIVNNAIYQKAIDEKYLLQALKWDQVTSPNKPSAYRPSSDMIVKLFWNGGINLAYNVILVPGMGLTLASPTKNNSYSLMTGEFFDLSGYWLGGLYALACEAKPGITPMEFLDLAYSTGDSQKTTFNGKEKTLERIINPNKLMKVLSEKVADK
ncbi:MAG: hypothetical protein N2376_06835 [Clostridia bacterium]|nr:hypothetical protein [Clostridia bacterium]